MDTVSRQHGASQAPVQPNKCAECRFAQMCLLHGLDAHAVALFDGIVKRHRIARETLLYRRGQPLTSLYAVRFGHFKVAQVDRRGAQQITGFAMSGEMVGLEAIAEGVHTCDAIALEDAEVCEVPYGLLQDLFAGIPQLMHNFHRALSQEIVRQQRLMQVLGNMRADQRFACFLLELSARYARRGYSPCSIGLRMSREDIGSYLGMTIESVSRLVARFRNLGWIRLHNRELELLDLASLQELALGGRRAVSPTSDLPDPFKAAA